MNSLSVPPLDATSRRWALLAGAACLLPLLLQLPLQLGAVIGISSAAVAALSWRQPLSSWIRVLLALSLVGIVFGATGFRMGRDTGCALLGAMLAIKPAETLGLRDARSLVGFALFAPFATFLLDQGPLALALGLVAALLALVALQRFAELESSDVAFTASPWRRLADIGRLLAIGLPLALATFWLFPRLGSPLWGVPERAVARPGLSDRMAPGEWVDLMSDDTPALRVRFFGATPARTQMYWRGPVLWRFDGRSWTQPRWLMGLPPAPAKPTATRWDYELEVEPTDRRQLVALDLPLTAPGETSLAIDHGLYTNRPLSALTRWRLQSAPPATYEPELKQTLRHYALDLPEGYNPRTLALARQWRSEAGSNDAAIVQRALDWVHREFAYTLETPLLGRHSVDEFLFDHKAGFCEHFSSSFVVLMRAAGIPARVVTGYTGGYYNRIGDYWLVRRSDAHAWSEVWLQGRGWVRVDPTAAVAPERIYDTLADRAPGAGGLLSANATPLLEIGDWLRRGWNDFVLGFNATRQQDLLKPFGVEKLDGPRLILLFATVAALALLWMLWLSTRGQREADPVLRAWHRLGARYRRLGLARDPHEAAGDWTERVSKARPELAAELKKLSDRFENWRYAEYLSGRRDNREARDLSRALRAHRPGTHGERR
jgi:transglutaminase-like putative cysteine protease